jgi:hypothetical protein
MSGVQRGLPYFLFLAGYAAMTLGPGAVAFNLLPQGVGPSGFAPLLVLAGVGIVRAALDAAAWQGPVAVVGVGWRRSWKSRLVAALDMLLVALLAFSVIDMAQQAWFNGDLPRTGVGLALALGLVAVLISSLVRLLSWRLLVRICTDELRAAGLPRGRRAWTDMTAISLAGSLEDRRVEVTGADGRVWRLDLSATGVTPRALLAEIGRLVPSAPLA